MVDDDFSKHAGKAIQAAVTGAAGLVSGPPGVVLAVGTAVTFSVFEALATRNDEALREFRVAALEGEVIALRDGLRALEKKLAAKGQEPDRKDPLTQSAVASSFVEGVAAARTTEKKQALVHATIAQFDPQKGSPATRDYWLRRIRELPEAELSFALLLAQHGQVAFFDGKIFQAQGGGRAKQLDFVRADVVVFATLAKRMTNVGYGALVHEQNTTIPYESRAVGALAYVLTSDGQTLVSFCKDD